MKLFAIILGVGMLIAPSVALAQTPPPMPPMPGMSRPDFAKFRHMHDQMEKIHRSERAQVLAALTPAHRALVASLIGGLAVAANPDPKAAAAKLDAALSPGEKSAVQKIHANTMKQMHDMMHQAMMQRHPQGQPSPQVRQFRRRHRPSAGELVLDIAASSTHPHDMMFMMRGGMMGHPHGPPRMKPPEPTPNPTST